jgi:1D-myo-inositol-triphosphate 3-kinase
MAAQARAAVAALATFAEERPVVLTVTALVAIAIHLWLRREAWANLVSSAPRDNATKQAAAFSPGAKTAAASGAAGHAGNLMQGGFFLKLEAANRFDNERAFLERLSKGDPISVHAPRFHGVEHIEGKRYLKMGSLLADFDTATLCQADVKMGVRCFAESELQSRKPRADLYERLEKMGWGNVLTAQERSAQTITKARWMRIRDSMSSTASLGFRVDGVVTPDGKRESFGDLATVREEGDVVAALRSFLPAVGRRSRRRTYVNHILDRLDDLEKALRASSLFASHEVIGSSLLFAADGEGNCGVWMLDFGLTCPAPGGTLSHDVPWEIGNHEDGYLTGLANLKRLWGRVRDEL